MKQVFRMFIAVLTLCAAGFTSIAQNNDRAFAADQPIVYLGVDFTQTKVINDFSATANDIKNRHFAGINQVIISEVKKYDWQKALDKTNISSDISLVTAKNEKIDESKISSTSTADESRLKAADIEKLVKQYDFKDKKGVGLILFMEALSKSSESGAMWVTFVNMDNKKVIKTERMVGKAQGFGFRNYYAYTVYKVMQDIKKHKMSEWRKS